MRQLVLLSTLPFRATREIMNTVEIVARTINIERAIKLKYHESM